MKYLSILKFSVNLTNMTFTVFLYYYVAYYSIKLIFLTIFDKKLPWFSIEKSYFSALNDLNVLYLILQLKTEVMTKWYVITPI